MKPPKTATEGTTPEAIDRDALKIGMDWLQDSSLERWFPFSAEKITELTKKIKRLEPRYEASVRALIKWRDYFQSDLPRNADEQEQQGEDFPLNRKPVMAAMKVLEGLKE